jgi:hypothetical protein
VFQRLELLGRDRRNVLGPIIFLQRLQKNINGCGKLVMSTKTLWMLGFSRDLSTTV